MCMFHTNNSPLFKYNTKQLQTYQQQIMNNLFSFYKVQHIQILTLQFHANFQALLKSTERTTFALRLIDVALAFGHARVHLLVLNGSLEESLARFACQQTVMVTGHFITANRA